MIDVKQAAKIAVESVQNLIGTNIFEPRIEEAELSEDEKYWQITVGFFPPAIMGSHTLNVPGGKREYKQVLVDSGNGSFKAMKIRTA